MDGHLMADVSGIHTLKSDNPYSNNNQ